MVKLKFDDLKSFLERPYGELEEMNLKAAQSAEKAGDMVGAEGLRLLFPRIPSH